MPSLHNQSKRALASLIAAANPFARIQADAAFAQRAEGSTIPYDRDRFDGGGPGARQVQPGDRRLSNTAFGPGEWWTGGLLLFVDLPIHNARLVLLRCRVYGPLGHGSVRRRRQCRSSRKGLGSTTSKTVSPPTRVTWITAAATACTACAVFLPKKPSTLNHTPSAGANRGSAVTTAMEDVRRKNLPSSPATWMSAPT